jgi:hypothetical protein
LMIGSPSECECQGTESSPISHFPLGKPFPPLSFAVELRIRYFDFTIEVPMSIHMAGCGKAISKAYVCFVLLSQ